MQSLSSTGGKGWAACGAGVFDQRRSLTALSSLYERRSSCLCSDFRAHLSSYARKAQKW